MPDPAVDTLVQQNVGALFTDFGQAEQRTDGHVSPPPKLHHDSDGVEGGGEESQRPAESEFDTQEDLAEVDDDEADGNPTTIKSAR